MNDIDFETRRRALAMEGVLMTLIERLATRGLMPIEEAEEMLRAMGRSSEYSAARTSGLLGILVKLRRLRGTPFRRPGSM